MKKLAFLTVLLITVTSTGVGGDVLFYGGPTFPKAYTIVDSGTVILTKPDSINNVFVYTDKDSLVKIGILPDSVIVMVNGKSIDHSLINRMEGRVEANVRDVLARTTYKTIIDSLSITSQ